MTPPLKVQTASLRKEADVWDAQAKQLGAAAKKAEELHLTRVEAGIFQLYVSSYELATDQVVDRCREGQQRMIEIAEALLRVAANYDVAEAKGVALFTKLF